MSIYLRLYCISLKQLYPFLLAFISLTTSAQDSSVLTIPVSHFNFSIGEYGKSYLTNTGSIIESPLHWKGKDWAIAGGTVATTTGLYFLDNEINKPFSQWQSGVGSGFGKTGNAIGPQALMASSLVLFGAGLITKSQSVTDFAADNLQAQLFTSVVTVLVKHTFGRARPSVGKGAAYFDGPIIGDDGSSSFFSGHSSLAFATATTVFLHCHKKWWVGLLSYGVATGIATSRLQHQSHWASDVFFGAVTGTAISSFIYHQNQKKRKTVVQKPLL